MKLVPEGTKLQLIKNGKTDQTPEMIPSRGFQDVISYKQSKRYWTLCILVKILKGFAFSWIARRENHPVWRIRDSNSSCQIYQRFPLWQSTFTYLHFFLRLIIYVSWSSVFYEPRVKLLNFIVCDSFLKLYSYNCKLTAFPNLYFEFITSLLTAFLDLRSKLQIFTNLNFMFSLS